MGLSASQARLLSITSRLTNNEFRAQTITNSKQRLATESQKTSRDYMNALNSQQLMFMGYDDNGDASKVELTPAVLYSYAPMKNQYMLIDNTDKVLVNYKEIQNYENTDTLLDFLKNYVDVKELPSYKYQNKYTKYNEDYAKYSENLNKYNNETYQAYLMDMDNYEKAKEQYESDMLRYIEEKKQYDEVDYPAYEAKLNDYNDNELQRYQMQMDQYYKDIYDYNMEFAIYEEELTNLPNNDMYKMFTSVVGNIYDPKLCYQHALDGSIECYAHVLTYLLGYDCADGTNASSLDGATDEDLYTSTGVKFNLLDRDIMGAALHGDEGVKLIPVGERMKDPELLCDGDDNYHASYRQNGVIYTDTEKENIIQHAIDVGIEPTEVEILKSDYIYDETTNQVAGIKTLKQKAIDLLYLIKNYSNHADYESIVNFTDGDFKSIATIIPPILPIAPKMPDPPTPPEPPTPPVFNLEAPILPEKPLPPQEPEPEYILSVNDQPKAQWYVNLWYKMNGSNTANVVKPLNLGETNSFNYYVETAKKSQFGKNYTEYDDNLFKSSEWIQFALEHGIVSIEQAKYFNPAEDSLKAKELTSDGYEWSKIIYTSARDFVQQDDEEAIAIAEIQYKKRITEIERQDTKLDQDLKKLDVEHNALSTEYESIKEALSKNVERSFKVFS